MAKTAATTANQDTTGIPGVPNTVTIREAADAVHCTPRQIQRLMYSGELAYYKPTPRKALIDAASLAALFAHPANEKVLAGGVSK